MRLRGKPWREAGIHLLLSVFDSTGAIRGLRGWRFGKEQPKRTAMAGFSVKGLILADMWGVAMLRGEGHPRNVLITEGEPDFLVAATRWGLLEEPRTATIGVVAGAWSEDLAARVPSGCTVILATDHDAAGERYAASIAATLADRCVLQRTIP